MKGTCHHEALSVYVLSAFYSNTFHIAADERRAKEQPWSMTLKKKSCCPYDGDAVHIKNMIVSPRMTAEEIICGVKPV